MKSTSLSTAVLFWSLRISSLPSTINSSSSVQKGYEHRIKIVDSILAAMNLTTCSMSSASARAKSKPMHATVMVIEFPRWYAGLDA